MTPFGQNPMADAGTILIVDDTPADLKLLVDILTAEGYQVLSADSGELALATIASRPPELILLGICRPCLDSFEVHRQIKARPEIRDIPVVMLSASVEVAERVKALKLGAEDFIGKPFHPGELLARVRTHLERRRLRIRLEQQTVELRRANEQLQSELAEQKRTEANRTEEALRLVHERLRRFVDANIVGTPLANQRMALHVEQTPLAVIEFDLNGRVREWNPAAVAIFGFSREEALGQYWHFIVPEAVWGQLDGVWAALISQRGGSRSTNENRTKDGRTISCEWFSTPLVDANGQTIAVASLVQDVTERRRAESEVERTAREWQTTFDATNDAIWILDRDHRVVRSNKTAERFFHRRWDGMLGQPCWTIVHGSTEPPPDCPFVRARQSGHRETMELQVGERWFEVVVDPIIDAAGQHAGAVHIVSDITERKQMEARFLRTQRLEGVGALAGGIAHDLNNLLAPILMSAPLLRETSGDAESRAMLDTIENCAQRGADILRQLLTFARGKPGARVPVPARHLLDEMNQIIQETFPRNIQPRILAPDELWPFLGDPTQIHQTLMNLCVNARDAMPDGGTLTLAAENATVEEKSAALIPEAKPGRFICLSVIDTGVGIPPEHLDRICDPFFTTKEIGKGTGLGLATVLGIVRGHGGFVRVKSKMGQGTTFELYLPASTEASLAGPTLVKPPQSRSHGELVLVVDDEAEVRKVIRRILEKQGYRVLAAAEGAEALALLAQHRAEVKAVLTDVMMPGMDGPTLVRCLRRQEPRLPVLVMTGLTEQAGVKGLSSLDLNMLLIKPFVGNELLTALHRAIAMTGESPLESIQP